MGLSITSSTPRIQFSSNLNGSDYIIDLALSLINLIMDNILNPIHECKEYNQIQMQ